MGSESRLPDDGRDIRRLDDIDQLLGEYIDRLNAGEKVLSDEVMFDHPDCGEEIVARLESFVAAMELTSSDTAPLGTLGDYTLRRQIGRGGMGVVYDAWQNSVERPVALKVLPAGIAADNKAFMRFMREARTAAQLKHQNIVGVYGMGQEENTPYYAMELVEGETLAQIIPKIVAAEDESETPFGVKKDDQEFYLRLARAFANVADGLQHAHSKGVVHRDIKPSNLILDTEADQGGRAKGRLRILDFGLARLEGQESLTISGDLVGTPLYMSPEQARQRKIQVDHRTDIYSLGATMYELLTGKPPFKGKDHQDTLSQIIEREPIEPRTLNQRVPRNLETIVLKCLRKEAGERYGTAEALGQDLRRFVRGDPIEARPQGRWEKAICRMAHHRKRIAVAVIILFLLLSGTVLIYRLFVAEKTLKQLTEKTLNFGTQFEDVIRVEGVNSPDFGDFAPVPSADGCEMFFGSLCPGGQGSHDIWLVWRPDPLEPWGTPRNLEELNSPSIERPTWISPDGLRLYYNTKVDEENEDEIRCAIRNSKNPKARWTVIFPEGLNTSHKEMSACLTQDELDIFFSSDRPGGKGKLDIWNAKRSGRDDAWNQPQPVEEMNTLRDDAYPCISPDGLTLFFCRFSGDVMWAERKSREDRFGPVRLLGPPVNSKDGLWEGHFRLSADWPKPGSHAYFMRGSSIRSFDIYRATWRPASTKPLFNSEGPIKENVDTVPSTRTSEKDGL